MIQLFVEQRKLQALAKQITRAKDQQVRLLPALARELSRGLVKIVQRRIKVTKTAPDGLPWRRWAASYAATRSAQHSLLMDTRKLYGSIEPYSAPSGKLVKVQSRLSYAGYVQAKRPFLGIGELERQLVDNLAERFMRRAVG